MLPAWKTRDIDEQPEVAMGQDMPNLAPNHLLFFARMALLILAGGVGIRAAAPPTASVALQPDAIYADVTLRGNASFSDPNDDLEGISTIRWLVNGAQVAAGEVPQSMLLPLDGSLLSTDGQAPVDHQGLEFVTGRFGQAIRTSPAIKSLLSYPARGNLGVNEGSIEMWVKLAYDLDDPVYDNYPHLFAYENDDEELLHIEIKADRVIVTSRKGNDYYTAWPNPPGWRADEWHHLAATWSVSANHLALYYDCVLVAEGTFAAFTGERNRFHLFSSYGGRGVMQATFDEVRLGRRALSADEIAATCSRGGPALNNEVILFPEQFAVGDVIIFELTPCNETGACGAPVSASAAVQAHPLGTLEPTPGLLPSGTIATTLQLTTTARANCRWSPKPDTPYDEMAHDFQQGQGTTLHSTVVSGLHDLDDRRFYVRCADLGSAIPRDPDDHERQTHLRVLGPWEGGYPRIANLWGNYDPELGFEFFAGYDLFIPYRLRNPTDEAAAIRAANPNAKVLHTQKATKGQPESDPLIAEWWYSNPGDPGYNCLLRDSNGDILLVEYWEHPMTNMTQPYCRMLLAQQNVEQFLSQLPEEGDDLAYDGIYWDLLYAHISWLGDDIDSDLDGQPDDQAVLDAAYRAGVQDFLSQVRARLPHVILVGNEAPPFYAPWLNGRLYEWQLPTVLDGADWLTWDEVVTEYRDWAGRGHTPHTTFIQSAPEPLILDKYPVRHLELMPLAMQAEAAASYRRMRYGLTSALMGDGLFSFDFGREHGHPWWYDEYGAPRGSQAATVLSLGYLGQPTGEPTLLADTLDTRDQTVNGGFEDGLDDWGWWVDSGAGAVATLDIDATSGISDTPAAHIVVTSSASPWSVKLYQDKKTIVAEQDYTLSFWARSDVTRTLYARIAQGPPPGTNFGFKVQALVTPQWQHFHLWDDASVTASDSELAFEVGEGAGELWLDNVQFQEGALGLWARSFETGLAVVNTTRAVQTATLPDTYYKLKGTQAPLFQTRVDDDEAQVSTGWSEQQADYNQFGETVHKTTAGTAHTIATAIYTPTLAYSGTYKVLAWVVPSVAQSSEVSVTIRHARGKTVVLLNQTAGEVGWRNLGTYAFDVGDSGSAALAATGNGVVIADALKWESTARYNDGSQVNWITLQPQDGIVLLSYDPSDRLTYLPSVTRNAVVDNSEDALAPSIVRKKCTFMSPALTVDLLRSLLSTVRLLVSELIIGNTR